MFDHSVRVIPHTFTAHSNSFRNALRLCCRINLMSTMWVSRWSIRWLEKALQHLPILCLERPEKSWEKPGSIDPSPHHDESLMLGLMNAAEGINNLGEGRWLYDSASTLRPGLQHQCSTVKVCAKWGKRRQTLELFFFFCLGLLFRDFTSLYVHMHIPTAGSLVFL